ncbi:hypothetical protein ACEPPN_000966 [Leptodophora sp. 'Broadleaf-Isolate-01']
MTAPCGSNGTLITTISSELTQSDTAVMLERFEIVLAQDMVTTHFRAGGNVELLVGDIAFHVTGDAFVTPLVRDGIVSPLVNIPHPDIDVHGGIPGDIIQLISNIFLGSTSPIWAVIQSMAIERVTQAISEAIKTALPSSSLPPPLDKLRKRIAAIEIRPDSIKLIGLVGRIFAPNELDPLFVDASAENRTTGPHILSGKAEHLTEIYPPTLNGPLTNTDAAVEVSGDATNGWKIKFLGTDGNFSVRFIATARDGSGKTWTAETSISHHGDQLEMPPAYETYRASCDEKFRTWFARGASGVHLGGLVIVHAGDPVMDEQIRESIAIRDLLSRGDVSAFIRAQDGVKQFGPGFLGSMGKVLIDPLISSGATPLST